MRKFKKCYFLFVFLFVCVWEKTAFPAEQVVLLITHPTVNNLKNIKELVDRDFLKLPLLKLIGIYDTNETTTYNSSRKYIKRNKINWMDIKEVKCNLAEFRALVDHSDGVIFTGGPDIPPTLYKEETRFTTRVKDPYRHYFEISFLSHLLSKSQNKPLLDDREEYLVLGICLGMQSINVACGGTLYQDILSDIYGLNTVEQACKIKGTNKLHRNPYAQLNSGSNLGHGVLHFLKFTEHAPKILVSGSKPISVLSSHHQAIKRLGKNLEVFATSADGKVIEGIVHTRYPNVIGIQFHAEKRVLWDQTIEYCEKDPRCGRNYIADKVRACPQCIDFHRRFWDTISKRLIQSVKRHFSQSVIIGANAYQNIADQYKYGCYYVSACTPTYPVGPCMVSTERTCSAYYKYTL